MGLGGGRSIIDTTVSGYGYIYQKFVRRTGEAVARREDRLLGTGDKTNCRKTLDASQLTQRGWNWTHIKATLRCILVCMSTNVVSSCNEYANRMRRCSGEALRGTSARPNFPRKSPQTSFVRPANLSTCKPHLKAPL